MRISDWSSDVCSSDLGNVDPPGIPDLDGVIHAAFDEKRKDAPADGENQADHQQQPTVEPPIDAGSKHAVGAQVKRSEERRVGKEWVSTCRSRWSPYP